MTKYDSEAYCFSYLYDAVNKRKPACRHHAIGDKYANKNASTYLDGWWTRGRRPLVLPVQVDALGDEHTYRRRRRTIVFPRQEKEKEGKRVCSVNHNCGHPFKG